MQCTSSVWNYIRAGVPQGSILGPLLFLVFINDIVNGIDSNISLFANGTSPFIIVENAPFSATCLFRLRYNYSMGCHVACYFHPV